MEKKKILQSMKKGKERKGYSYLLVFFLKKPQRMRFVKKEQKTVDNVNSSWREEEQKLLYRQNCQAHFHKY